MVEDILRVDMDASAVGEEANDIVCLVAFVEASKTGEVDGADLEVFKPVTLLIRYEPLLLVNSGEKLFLRDMILSEHMIGNAGDIDRSGFLFVDVRRAEEGKRDGFVCWEEAEITKTYLSSRSDEWK